MSNTAPSRADPVVVFPLGRWCPPQETLQPHPPPMLVKGATESCNHVHASWVCCVWRIETRIRGCLTQLHSRKDFVSDNVGNIVRAIVPFHNDFPLAVSSLSNVNYLIIYNNLLTAVEQPFRNIAAIQNTGYHNKFYSTKSTVAYHW